MKKRWILCTVAVLCIAAALLGCGKKNVGTPEDNAVVEEDDKKNDNTGEGGRLFGFSGIDMSNPFYDTLKNSVQTALEAQGDRLMVRDPASDADLQNEQIPGVDQRRGTGSISLSGRLGENHSRT